MLQDAACSVALGCTELKLLRSKQSAAARPLLPCVHVSSPCSMPPEAPAGRQPVAGLACQPELCLSSRVTSVG